MEHSIHEPSGPAPLFWETLFTQLWKVDLNNLGPEFRVPIFEDQQKFTDELVQRVLPLAD